MQASSEAEAVALVRAGDVSAYSQLVQTHQDAAFRAAYLVLHDAAEAEDVAQEAFVRALRQIGRFRQEDAFRPWILRIVTNLALNELRRRRRGLSLLERFGAQPRPPAPSPESLAAASEETREVWEAIQRLKPDDRVILYLRYFLELSEAEMAVAIGKAPGTVKSRLHRASQRLRNVIEKHYPHLKGHDD